MAMKLRLASQMPQNLTPEEVELKAKFAEYKEFLTKKNETPQHQEGQSAMETAKKILAAQEEKKKLISSTGIHSSSKIRYVAPTGDNKDGGDAKRRRLNPATVGSTGFLDTLIASTTIENKEPEVKEDENVAPAKDEEMQEADDENSKVVCVTDLPDTITESRLRDAFGVFGNIVKLELEAAEHYALITYASVESANNAADDMNNTVLDGAAISAYIPDLEADAEEGAEDEDAMKE